MPKNPQTIIDMIIFSGFTITVLRIMYAQTIMYTVMRTLDIMNLSVKFAIIIKLHLKYINISTAEFQSQIK